MGSSSDRAVAIFWFRAECGSGRVWGLWVFSCFGLGVSGFKDSDCPDAESLPFSQQAVHGWFKRSVLARPSLKALTNQAELM